MTKYSPHVERAAELIVYHVQTNESIELSGKSRHDIFHKLRAENHALRWNELRLYLKRMEPEGYAEILAIMERLDRKESIR